MVLKITNLVLTGVFALFAWFQLNDPDPVLWTSLYGSVAILSLLAFFGIYPIWALVIGMVVCVGGAVYLLPSVWDWLINHPDVSLLTGMSAERMYIEESRECFGLLLALACLVFHYFAAKKLR
ncbi:MAG: transmembrane 220 family protein [Cytophagales bacterium]|nr:transmembrane 220 family protein [Bernardetiaceae bacterium]MDW8211399.1 transmembrane 220 family protein [Cytophagales bacterium]